MYYRAFSTLGVLFYLLQVIRSLLIDVVVEPVGVEQVGMCSPAVQRSLVRVVVTVVVSGLGYIQSLVQVTSVLSIESIG